jgi:hypothetical protein
MLYETETWCGVLESESKVHLNQQNCSDTLCDNK